ncbi:MAG: class I SAM-dependent methyltransferase [Gammaproteobacteria bacterium]
MRIAVVCTLLALLSPGAALADAALEAAATGAHRKPEHVARNAWRHPVETLSFFGIRPDMTVVEIWPGGTGWYTEVLAPYLRDGGKLIAANYDGRGGSEYRQRADREFRAKLAARPDVYDQVEIQVLEPPAAPDAAPAGSADMVVTFRNLHNWVRDGYAEAMFAAMYRALKPGGTLGLVAHRGTDDMVGAEAAKTGYLAESEALRLAAAAGFEFVAKSEVNANPQDTRDHPRGVWTLPPNFRLGDTDRDKYAAIGESDRMTMKFVKP